MGSAPGNEVAIIGAGAAGLAAARRLMEAGLRPLVLEARSRTGGRAHTEVLRGMPLDLGCGWLHSADRNDWVAIARALGLTVTGTAAPWKGQSGNIRFPAEDQAAFRDASEALDARVEEAAQRGEEGPAALWLDPGNRWNPLVDAVSTYYNGTELDRVSIVDYHRYVDTGWNWRVREGLGTAVARFGADVDVRLDWPVTRIDHGGTRLRLEGPHGTVEIDRLIVTVPPTIVHAGSLRFAPTLPDKLAAAAGLPLGLANKAYLALEVPDALPDNGHVFGQPDRRETGSYTLKPLGQPVIEGYFGGAWAEALERQGRAGFAAFAMDELAGVYGSSLRRQLTPLVTTAWRSDPFALGAYSHALPGHADDRAVWAAPVDERMFFAGEACSREDFSTVHGAYRTGRAAADALMAALRAEDRPSP